MSKALELQAKILHFEALQTEVANELQGMRMQAIDYATIKPNREPPKQYAIDKINARLQVLETAFKVANELLFYAKEVLHTNTSPNSHEYAKKVPTELDFYSDDTLYWQKLFRNMDRNRPNPPPNAAEIAYRAKLAKLNSK